jgi:hypothetical protein
MNRDIIFARYEKYVKACLKRCEDADVSLGTNRTQKIRWACIGKITDEERPNLTTVEMLNLMFLLIYQDKIKDMIPDGVKMYNMIPQRSKEQIERSNEIWFNPVVLGVEHGLVDRYTEKNCGNMLPPGAKIYKGPKKFED